MRYLVTFGILSALLAASTSSALAGNTVAIRSRTAKVFDESEDEVCRLSRKTKIEATALIEDSEFVLVKIPIRGCPNEGLISKKDLKGSLKGLPTQTIEEGEEKPEEEPEVPEEETAEPAEKPEEVAESDNTASQDCVDCATRPAPQDKALVTVDELIRKINSETPPKLRTFNELSKKWKTNKDNRKLVQIPVLGKIGNIGPCGSHHYNPDDPPGIDAYVTPHTGCMMTALMQKWKKDFCPSRKGCTLQWGDASHGEKVRFPPHKTHRDGSCIDIRPMRKGGFDDTPLTHSSGAYDRATTQKLVNLANSMGASLVIFNDRKIKARRAKGHHNHLHICFTPNKVSNKVCQNLKVDPNTCGELP